MEPRCVGEVRKEVKIMKKKPKKTGMKFLHPLGDKLEEVMDVMEEVQKSLDTWKVDEYDLGPPCIVYNEETGKIDISTSVGDYWQEFSIEDFVNQTFDGFECGSHAYAEPLIEFRRQFDEAVLKRFEKYAIRNECEGDDGVAWAKNEIAIYKKELDGKV